jgi:hypothetical protein
MEDYINGLKVLAQQVDITLWSNIRGPIWLTEDQWEREVNPKASHTNGFIIIDSNFTVAMKWKP